MSVIHCNWADSIPIQIRIEDDVMYISNSCPLPFVKFNALQSTKVPDSKLPNGSLDGSLEDEILKLIYSNQSLTASEMAKRLKVGLRTAYRVLGGSVFIRQYRDRLVVESPGGFPNGISLENILNRQLPRNRRIAEILALCGLVERAGQGMNLIYELSIKEAKELPDFTGTDDYFVFITLHGMILDPDMLSCIKQIGDDKMEILTTEDLLVINALFHELPLHNHLQHRLKRLAEMGIIEHIGRNKYILARRLYAAVGKSGVHTRVVGLDRSTNKELLYQHIQSNGEKGTVLKELEQVLPGLNRRQIQRLTYELRDEGRIYCTGRTSAARWYAIHTSGSGANLSRTCTKLAPNLHQT